MADNLSDKDLSGMTSVQIAAACKAGKVSANKAGSFLLQRYTNRGERQAAKAAA